MRFELLPTDSSRRFVLWNGGDGIAYSVHVDLSELLRQGPGDGDQKTEFAEFAEGFEHQYWKASTSGSLTQEYIEVTWHHRADLSDEPKSKRLRVP